LAYIKSIVATCGVEHTKTVYINLLHISHERLKPKKNQLPAPTVDDSSTARREYCLTHGGASPGCMALKKNAFAINNPFITSIKVLIFIIGPPSRINYILVPIMVL
jgi:hypothetical protein